MPTDATGTPTSLGIRKYNTSADAPSGLGFNGAMDDIDALLLARVTKPSGIASGEVPVWNGTTFVRSSATQVGYRSQQTRPGINVTLSAPQSLTSAVAAGIVFNIQNTLTDANGIFSFNSGTGVITVNETGWYIVSSYLAFATSPSTAGDRLALTLQSGSEVGRNYAPGTLPNITSTPLLRIASGQTVAVQAFQNSGGALNLLAAGLTAVQVGI